MKKTVNRFRVQGYLYQHKIEKATAGPQAKHPGSTFYRGDVQIATDEALTNIITVHFRYASENDTNKTNFDILRDIYDGIAGTVVKDGKDGAKLLQVDTSILRNEWFDARNNFELVSTMQNDGGFLRSISSLPEDENSRNSFTVDTLLTKCIQKTADPDRGIEKDYVELHGYVFNFRNEIFPAEFRVENTRAQEYFIDLGISESNPVFTQLSGREISTTLTTKKSAENAWGEVIVTETTHSNRAYLVTSAIKVPYEFNEDGAMTPAELKKALADREVSLSDQKASRMNFANEKSKQAVNNFSTPAAVPSASTANGTFSF